jgi:hypothetical protein
VSTDVTIAQQQGAGVFACQEIIVSLSMNPSVMDISFPPASATVSGALAGSFKSTYGMPQTQYVGSNGILAGVAVAGSISADGTSISASPPDFSSAQLGTYTGLAGNITASGALDVVGGGFVTVKRSKICNPGRPPAPVE